MNVTKKLNENECRNKGITLIALVITIIVLLILAGVSIATLTGDNGVLTKSTNAKLATEQANILEQLRMEIYEKKLDIENNTGYIEYLKSRGIITEETSVGELVKYASINSGIKLSSTQIDDEDETQKYIVNVNKLISNPSTGKGNLEKGDVYYILNGDLYYLSEKKETTMIGSVFSENQYVVDESCFNYVINDNDEVEIIGLNFNNIDYEVTEYSGLYPLKNGIKWDIGTLVIPEKIQGKNVVSISFNNSIDDNKIGNEVSVGGYYHVVLGIKEIKYPKTVKKIGDSTIMFQDIENIKLPQGLVEISGKSFTCNKKVSSITIPSSVKVLKGTPFHLWDKDSTTINIEGKDSASDFEEVDKDVFTVDLFGINPIKNINYLGK